MRELSENEAIALFLKSARAHGASTTNDDENDAVRAIVRELSFNRAAIVLAAARSSELTFRQIATALEALAAPAEANDDARAAIERAEAHRLLGRLEEAAAELERVVTKPGDSATEIDARRLLGAVYRTRGRSDEALVHLERAFELARVTNDLSRTIACVVELGATLATLGRLAEARSRHEEAVALARTQRARREEGVALSHMAVSLHRAGLFSEAERAHREALAIHREVGHRRLEAAESMHLGHVAHELGDLPAARDHFAIAIATFEEVGDRALLGVAMSHAALVEAEAKRPEQAGPLARQALEIHREAKSARHEARTWIHLALHSFELGDLGPMREALDRALAKGDALEPSDRVWALALEGRIAEAEAIAHEDRATKRAIAILAGRDSANDETSIRVRYATRAFRNRIPSLVVDADARSVTTADGHHIDLSRKGAPGRVLALLVKRRLEAPGTGVSWQELLDAGWPGQRVQAEAGFVRVRNALFQLRKLGLKSVLLTSADGYLLDPAVPVEERGSRKKPL